MRSQAFIHFLLIAVLGFSPLAANMHFISHFHDCENGSAAASFECGHDDHQHTDYHAGHQVNLAHDNAPSFNEYSEAGLKSSAISADCSIYHVYIGLSGCLSTAHWAFTSPVNAAIQSVTTLGDLTTEAVDRPSIRGPPIPS